MVYPFFMNELLVGGGVASRRKRVMTWIKKRGVVYFDYFRRGVDVSVEKLVAR